MAQNAIYCFKPALPLAPARIYVLIKKVITLTPCLTRPQIKSQRKQNTNEHVIKVEMVFISGLI